MGSRLLEASAPTLGSIPREPRLAEWGAKSQNLRIPLSETCVSGVGRGQKETLRIWRQLPAALAGWY